jgi:hypothetical protein
MDHDLYGKSKAFLWHQCKYGPYDFSFDVNDLKEFLGAHDQGRSEEVLLYLQGEGLIHRGENSRYLLTQPGRAWALEQELSSPHNWAKKIEDIRRKRHETPPKRSPQNSGVPLPSDKDSTSTSTARHEKTHNKSESQSGHSKKGITLSMEKQPRKNQVKVLLDDSELKYLESLVGTVGDDKASILRNLLFAHFHRSEGIQENTLDPKNSHQEANEEEMERLANLLPAMLFSGHQNDQVLSDIAATEGFSINKDSSDEEIRSILSLAAKSATGSIVNLIPEGGKVRERVSGYLEGIRLLYDGIIELHEQTVPIRFLWFRPNA